MKKVISLLLIFSFLFVMNFVLAEDFNDISVEPTGEITEEHSNCINEEGTWTTFNNGCVDSCDYVRNPSEIMCTQAITEGCECGPDKCWNGESCEDNIPQVINGNNETQSSEKICCKIYGYGARMEEVNVRYSLIEKERCTVPDNFVGGGREIVDNSYCRTIGIDDPSRIPNGEKPVQERKAIAIQQVIQTRNRLQVMAEKGDCPENCTCDGSSMKCQTQEGNREMIVRAGNSGNTIVQVKNSEMNTNVELFKSDDGGVFGVFEGEKTKRIILPDKVSEVAKQKLQERIKEEQRNRKRINLTDENITLNEEGIYEYRARKKAKLFWIIPVEEKFKTQVDAETGAVIKTRHSWWGFLARDLREDIYEE